MSDRCPNCKKLWWDHSFQYAKDGLIAFILSYDGERVICRTKVKVEVA